MTNRARPGNRAGFCIVGLGNKDTHMHALTSILVPVIVVVVVGLIIWWVAERFSPDPLITKIVQVVVFAVVLIVLLLKLLPLLGI